MTDTIERHGLTLFKRLCIKCKRKYYALKTSKQRHCSEECRVSGLSWRDGRSAVDNRIVLIKGSRGTK